MTYTLAFDSVIMKQLKKASKDAQIKTRLKDLLDKIEEKGPDAGELLDGAIGLYEVRSMHPPIRLYYRYRKGNDEILVFEYEMKNSEEKQQKTIDKLRSRDRRA